MKNISELLKRFKNLKVPDESVRKEFQRMVFEKYSIEIPFSKIKIQNNVIYFSAPSVLKQEIKLDERDILKKINKKLNTKINKII